MNEIRLFDPFGMEPLEETFRSLYRPWSAEIQDTAPTIKMDVSEQDGSYTVKAEIPGVRKEDIEVRVDGAQVTISAEVKKEKEEKKDGRVLRSERHYGYASRSFTLGCPVDESKTEARYENGVLQLTLAKKAAATTQRIAVH